VPFVYCSVNALRTLHPTTNVVPTLPPEMSGPFRRCLVAFLLLFTALTLVRARLEANHAMLEEAYAALDD
jgi:hypothetical protein